ncbi:MAG TPA: cytochrome c biogenesis protein CcsA [Vicinamibacterales bacterium]|nr:cytochrome c biogenesis protein CcsA [Vicinamibacterales bacterium]
MMNLALLAAALMFAAAPWMIMRAPQEATMGLIQKIFYFHVPAAFVMFITAFVSGIAGGVYLFRRSARADRISAAAGELVVIFGAIVLLTGPIWARKAWGVWWQWDARLTITLVMWLIFVAFLLLRKYGGPGSETLSSAVALFGMANVPFVYWSVNIWRTVHPSTNVVPSLQPGMREAFWFCVVAYLLLYAAFLAARVKLEEQRGALDELHFEIGAD